MKNLPEEPTEEQIEHVKARIVDEFQDVFSDGGAVLKPMACEPSDIDVVAEAVPIRVSTARKLAYALREETKKELDLMVQQGVIKPVGDVQLHGVIRWFVWRSHMVVLEFVWI